MTEIVDFQDIGFDELMSITGGDQLSGYPGPYNGPYYSGPGAS